MDRRSFLLCFSSLLLACVFGSPAVAKDKEKNPKKPKVVAFCVIQTGAESFEAVPQKDLKKVKKEKAKEHKDAVKAWTEAKKEAKKAKEKFTEPKPKAKPFKIVAKGLKGEEGAQAHIAKLLEAIRKAKEKKSGKKPAKQEKKPTK